MYRNVELKVLKTFLDKNDPFYYLGVPTIMKKPKYETYRREKRCWRNLWLSQWSYFATFTIDPKTWSDNIVETNYN